MLILETLKDWDKGRNFLWPGIDAIFAAEGIFDRQSSIVQFQGREAAFVQADHLSMCQCIAVGIVACMDEIWRH